MGFEKNTLLFGADPMPRIVAIELGETGTVKVYRRENDGSTSVDVEPFHPFVWADSDVVDLGVEAEKLRGDLKYGWLVTVDSWKELIALRNALKNSGRDFFAFTDPVQHYLTATGRSLFKELPFEELKRMQLEVLRFTEGEVDQIMSVALSDNTGWEELIVVSPRNAEASERAVIKRLTSLIKERDPDVIEGHDLFRVDLPYLVARAKQLKTKLDWGRSGGFLRSRPSRLQIAEKTIDYPKFALDGRQFVDTFLLAQFYDVGMRTLAGFERLDVAKHFGLCDEDEFSGLAGKELQRAYLHDGDSFRQRALCAVRETRAIADLLSPSYFIQAQIFPYNYQDTIVRGNATRINALFLREYVRQRQSIPELPVPRMFEGGYTDIFFTGVARNVWHCDVASLYPSIMLQFDCFPATDQLQIFRHFLTDLRTFRLEAKAKLRAAKDAKDQRHLEALQNTFKILLNSFYGYLGFAQGHFADFDAAARVTQIGRDLLRKMIEWLSANGAKVIEVDTDGIYLVPPEKIDIDELQNGLAKELPPGIDIEVDEQFEAMFSYKAKNYALLTRDGDVIIKGGALKSRGLEKFQRVFLEAMIKLIMDGRPEAILDLRNEYERKIRNREWKIDMLMKTDTLQDSLDKYRAKIAGSARNRAAAYELALASGRTYKPGDQISYYIKSTPKKVPAYEAAKLASDFDPQNRDENLDYYVAKLDELVKKFSGLIAAASVLEQKSLAL
ncbi:MAG TPA: DNA polymerase domain-containing protein [Chthoniobacterales bacterium]|nr:DNA polymerase domain-containing protein [Chthoniobacterales bacterium]